eukprot:1224180-Rhodomonas_salina.8
MGGGCVVVWRDGGQVKVEKKKKGSVKHKDVEQTSVRSDRDRGTDTDTADTDSDRHRHSSTAGMKIDRGTDTDRETE